MTSHWPVNIHEKLPRKHEILNYISASHKTTLIKRDDIRKNGGKSITDHFGNHFIAIVA